MSRMRNSAWRPPALGFVCAGVVYCWTVLSFISSSSLLAWSDLASPVKSSPVGTNHNNAAQATTVRWNEEQPGCTFSRGDDGKYRYGLWSEDVGVVLAVDAREVQVTRHRIEPIFTVLLEIHYRGADSLDSSPAGITLQFMKHFKTARTALDPNDYTKKIQADADALRDQTRRAVAKHPEEKQVREGRQQDYQQSINELIEFLSKNSLRPAHLDRANPEVSGWVFFNAPSRQRRGLNAQEEFVLRVPLGGRIFEFPFKLPSEPGELLLQKRQ